jgi:tryptophan synthase alpha chain
MSPEVIVPRYERMFAGRRAGGVLVPFLMLGDPTPERCLALADVLVAAGADALELGIPFSDPTADGPVIQRAAARALVAGATPPRCLQLVTEIRRRHPDVPIGLLVYANTVVRHGLAGFYAAAAAAGADSVLVADVPAAESAPFLAASRAAGIHPICVVPPNPTAAVIRHAAACSGYTYLQGRPGVTGAATPMAPPDRATLDALRTAGAPPALIGFGVSRREHVQAALDAGAAGVIIGSALVSLIEGSDSTPDQLDASMRRLMQNLTDTLVPA